MTHNGNYAQSIYVKYICKKKMFCSNIGLLKSLSGEQQGPSWVPWVVPLQAMPPCTVGEGYRAYITTQHFRSITRTTVEEPPMSVTVSPTTATDRKPRLLVLFSHHTCSTNWSTRADVLIGTPRCAQLNLGLFLSEIIIFQGSIKSFKDTVSVRCTHETECEWQSRNPFLVPKSS